jgi:hypothetical protein
MISSDPQVAGRNFFFFLGGVRRGFVDPFFGISGYGSARIGVHRVQRREPIMGRFSVESTDKAQMHHMMEAHHQVT